jgi:glycerol uptake facilitator-like aquaporin
MPTSLLKQCVAELIGTFTLIFIGVGAAGLIGGRFLIKQP